MRYIITEAQNFKIKALRVLEDVDELVELRLRNRETFDICKWEKNDYLDYVVDWVIEGIYYSYFSDLDDDSEEWSEIWNLFKNYIIKKKSNKIINFFENKCKQ